MLDAHGTPLQPCPPARARKLLAKGRAVVHRHTPFVIRLKDRLASRSQVDGVELGIDPGSRHTGIMVFTSRSGERRGRFGLRLDHRGTRIRQKMEQRSSYRRSRRFRNLRYRAPRFSNRARRKGWLPPSLGHRVVTTLSWVERMTRWAPVHAAHVEENLFDTHVLSEGRALSGREYQQGTLRGYEIREYLLHVWDRRCAYCGGRGVPLAVEHIRPRSRGGSDRPDNLTIACEPCNQAKGASRVEDFLRNRPRLLKRILSGLKPSLRDAAAVQSVRRALLREVARRVPASTATGGRTRWNRARTGVAKSHTLDALVVGEVDTVTEVVSRVLAAGCTGRGTHCRTRSDRYGFPRLLLPRRKRFFGFTTGDLVRAVIPRGANVGTHVGRVAVRTTGRFSLRSEHAFVGSVSHHRVRLLQRADGYSYSWEPEARGA
ncbi:MULTISPECIES: RNA-guided endonuclease IscB [unclassified Nocardiopsis]|uniref:RNA-guided endonuclease IscB n=1 Tax=Nocardiopsis TaxID=2013 RepID=UPI00387B0677